MQVVQVLTQKAQKISLRVRFEEVDETLYETYQSLTVNIEIVVLLLLLCSKFNNGDTCSQDKDSTKI